MAKVSTVEAFERSKVVQKFKRFCGLEPDEIEKIGRCSCGAILFCVRVFTGGMDSQCKFVHICSDLKCSLVKENNSLSLRPKEDPQCPLCEEEKDSIAMAVVNQRRISNYNKQIYHK